MFHGCAPCTVCQRTTPHRARYELYSAQYSFDESSSVVNDAILAAAFVPIDRPAYEVPSYLLLVN